MKAKKQAAGNNPVSRPKRRIVILAVPPANELDVVGPFQVFGTVNRLSTERSAPYQVEVVSSARIHSILGTSGLSILAHSFYQDTSEKIDTLLIAGGRG